MIQKLNFITLGICDFDRSVDFFEKGLGWKKSDASVEALALFPSGGIVLATHPSKDLADHATVSPVGSGFSCTLSYNAKSKLEVELTKGTSFATTSIKPSRRVYRGGYSGYFRDLDGHLFDITHPHCELDLDLLIFDKPSDPCMI